MKTRSRLLVAALAVGLVGAVPLVATLRPASADRPASIARVANGPPPIRWVRGSDPCWLRGEVSVGAQTPRVADSLSDPANWSRRFGDIRGWRVIRRNGDAWHVWMDSRVLGFAAEYDIYRRQGTRWEIHGTSIAFDLRAVIELTPSADASHTDAALSACARTVGIVSLFVPQSTAHEGQQRFIASYLTDLQRAIF